MSLKRVLVAALCLTALGIAGIFLAFSSPVPAPDVVFINDAVVRALENDDSHAATQELSAELASALAAADEARQSRDRVLQVSLSIIVAALVVSSVLFYWYCDKRIITPFRKMKEMTQRIAAGNLDVPLEMDRDNTFGAFTESFDILREELRLARENEHKANQSKKELVASLSHDIKTPVASIQATAELMSAQSDCEREKRQLDIIGSKAKQIDELITDMFHATLEELQALRVEPIELESTQVIELIQDADHNKRVGSFSIPDAIVLADPLRLRQVFSNIISNSYKYAATDICVTAFLEEQSPSQTLVIEIKDFGPGVAESEEALLCNKFFRGENASNQEGYGLGLFIAQHLMEQMSGTLSCENTPDGFAAKISIPLAS